MRRVVLISCGSSKQSRPMPAKDLYIGPLFRSASRYAQAVGCRWYIVSALHGLVSPQQVLRPYDAFIRNMSPRRRLALGCRVVNELALREPARTTTVELHLGKAYRDALNPWLVRQGFSVSDPLSELPDKRVGFRLQWYAEQIRKLSSA